MKPLSISVAVAAAFALLAGITKGGGDVLGFAADPTLLSIGAVGLMLACTTVGGLVASRPVGAQVPFDRIVQVGKPERIAEEEYPRVVAHNVPVALLGIVNQDLRLRRQRWPRGAPCFAGARSSSQSDNDILIAVRPHVGLAAFEDFTFRDPVA